MDDARTQDRERDAGAAGAVRGGPPAREVRRSSRVLAVSIIALLSVSNAGAQALSSAHELSFAGAGAGANCVALPTLGTIARIDGPYGAFVAEGAAGIDQEQAPQARGAARFDLHSPEWRSWSLRSNAQWSSPETVSCGLRTRDRSASVEAAHRLGAGGLWLAYRWRANDPLLHPASPAGFSVGAWRELGPVVMSLSLGTQPDTGTRTSFSSREVVRVDSFFNDTLKIWETFQHNITVVDTTVDSWRSRVLESRANLAWSRGRWAADGTLGLLWGRQGSSPAAWGVLSTSFALTPRLAVVGGFVAAPRRGLYLDPGRRVATLGFRVSPLPASASRPVPARLPPRGFEARDGEGDEIVLALRAPNARYVEVAGDFTTWQARRMRPGADGWWELPVRLRPGRYQINVRVDGARWMPPPGLPAVRDEFGGSVGVLVVR